MKHLGIEKADVMGYSLGAGTALQTTIRHPAVVRKLVVVSTVFKHDGWYPEILAAMAQLGPAAAEQLKQTPLYQNYSRIAPKPENWPVLVAKMGDLLRKDYDWSKEVAAIKAPTMIVVGDADSMRPEHAVEFFELLGGGKKDGSWDGSGISNARLAILPGLTHYNIFASRRCCPRSRPFSMPRCPLQSEFVSILDYRVRRISEAQIPLAGPNRNSVQHKIKKGHGDNAIHDAGQTC